MSEIIDDLGKNETKRYSKKFYVKMFLLFVAVILFGIYAGNVFFGKSSLEVLLELQNNRDNIAQNVKLIKKQNALLQKEYFELKQLEPTN